MAASNRRGFGGNLGYFPPYDSDPDDQRVPLEYPPWAPYFVEAVRNGTPLIVACDRHPDQIHIKTVDRYRFGDRPGSNVREPRGPCPQFVDELYYAMQKFLGGLLLIALDEAINKRTPRILGMVLQGFLPDLFGKTQTTIQTPTVIINYEEARAQLARRLQLAAAPDDVDALPSIVDADAFTVERAPRP